MSGVGVTGAWSVDKSVSLSGHKKHPHIPSPIEPKFTAPSPAPILNFGLTALIAAVGRTATIDTSAPAAVLNAVQKSTSPLLETMIDGGSTFALSEHFAHLIDSERSSLAARIGAGITDLYMNALGYAWRANASCLSSTLDPHADFIYYGGNANNLGVVLAEAHGSFAAQVTASSILNRSEQKYVRQVEPYLAQSSPFGKVIHGYAIAFGCSPKNPGAFLGLSETEISSQSKKLPPSPYSSDTDDPIGQIPTALALANHRSSFILMGCDPVVAWIDWALNNGTAPETEPLIFHRLKYAGRSYLVWLPPWWSDDILCYWPDYFEAAEFRRRLALRLLARSHQYQVRQFAIEEDSGISFLKQLTNIVSDGDRSPSEVLTLQSENPVGFGFNDLRERRRSEDYDYALFRDGLALLGNPYRGRILGSITWSPRDGVSSK